MRHLLLILAYMLFSSPVFAQDHDDPPQDPMICEQRSNLDTCWQLGKTTEPDDPAAALAHFVRSCDFRSQVWGCYGAGKLYLHNTTVRDNEKAYTAFEIVCNSDDTGSGPYGCKHLGWMHHTGIGATRDPELAYDFLSRACFVHNDLYLIDPEGCHFLAQNIADTRGTTGTAQQLAYILLSMGCMDYAEGVCDEAQALYTRAANDGASWIAECDALLTSEFPEGFTCGDFPDHSAFVPNGSLQAFDLNQLTRGHLTALFSG
ncbi:MAG: hypothetical protein ABJH45_21385 [Paracoccaceae bacterium]